MKKTMLLIGILAISTYSYCQHKRPDPIHHPNFEASVISELNEPFISAIERHLFESKAYRIRNKRNCIVLVQVSPNPTNIYYMPKQTFDSIYGYNDFKTHINYDTVSTPITYHLNIILVNKDFLSNGWKRLRENNFYYNYNGYDVVLTSSLNLIFNTSGEKKLMKFDLMESKRMIDKKHYEIETTYTFWGTYLRQYKLKDIISPKSKASKNEFK